MSSHGVTAPMVPVAGWRSRIVGTGEEAPGALIANERNWRTHPKAQRAALAGVLDEVGYVATVLVNRRTGRLVDGHLRVDLALSRREAAIPVTYVDLSPEEEAIVLASLDPLSAMAGTDDEKIRALLASVSIESEALAAMLAGLAPRVTTAGLTDPDDIPEPPDEATPEEEDAVVDLLRQRLDADAKRATDKRRRAASHR